MTDEELEANYHHCAICGIAPCDCGERLDTGFCAGCHFCACDMEVESEGAEAPHA